MNNQRSQELFRGKKIITLVSVTNSCGFYKSEEVSQMEQMQQQSTIKEIGILEGDGANT